MTRQEQIAFAKKTRSIKDDFQREDVRKLLGEPDSIDIDEGVSPQIEALRYNLGAMERNYTRRGFLGFYPRLGAKSQVAFTVCFYLNDDSTGCWSYWSFWPVESTE